MNTLQAEDSAQKEKRVACTLAFVLAGFACSLVLAAALTTPFGAHPDESFHALTAGFYKTCWLPPAANDPRVIPFLHPDYGRSYLLVTPPKLVYLLAAKFARVIEGAAVDFNMGLRLFNVALFVILCAVVLHRARDGMGVLFLMLTPQLWYIFSCFNGDALAFFLAFLTAVQLGYPDSLVGRYLDPATRRTGPGGGVVLGVLLGLSVLAKPHYYVVLAFVAAYAAGLVWAVPPCGRAAQLRKWLFVAAIACAVVLPVLACDLAINGPDKARAVSHLREAHAADGYKPSQMGTPEAFWGQAMKARGVGLAEVLWERHWLKTSYESFTGVYGNMDLYGPAAGYVAQGCLFLALAAAAVFAVRRRRLSRRKLALLLAGVGFASLVILQSLGRSWMFDFQAQGRYWLPILPILLLTWLGVMGPGAARWPCRFAVAAFVLGACSFIVVCLGRLAA